MASAVTKFSCSPRVFLIRVAPSCSVSQVRSPSEFFFPPPCSSFYGRFVCFFFLVLFFFFWMGGCGVAWRGVCVLTCLFPFLSALTMFLRASLSTLILTILAGLLVARCVMINCVKVDCLPLLHFPLFSSSLSLFPLSLPSLLVFFSRLSSLFSFFLFTFLSFYWFFLLSFSFSQNAAAAATSGFGNVQTFPNKYVVRTNINGYYLLKEKIFGYFCVERRKRSMKKVSEVCID